MNWSAQHEGPGRNDIIRWRTGLGMRLPNHEQAVVPREKIRDYLLSASHPDGRHKAAFFLRFGFNRDSWQTLGEALRQHAAIHNVVKTETTRFGVRYVIEGKLLTPSQRHPYVRVVWFIRNDQEMPYFVTAYPLRRKQR